MMFNSLFIRKGKVIKRKKLSSGILFTIQDDSNKFYPYYLCKKLSNYSILLKRTHLGLLIKVQTDMSIVKLFENDNKNVINIEIINGKCTKKVMNNVMNVNKVCPLYRNTCVRSSILSFKNIQIPSKCVKINCKFRHKLLEYDIKSIIRSIKQREICLSEQFDENDPFKDNQKTTKYRRASKFTEWIINQFGHVLQRNKSIILDIAGGSGDMACLLTIKGYKVIVIDPFKPKQFPKWQIKKLQNYFQSNRQYMYYQHIEELFNDRFIFKYSNIINKCDLMIGMHPDQATEFIVKYAKIFNKNIAVVPCCVFAMEFPHRMHKHNDGNMENVNTYSQFIQYLLQINNNLQTDYLPFKGKNKILYATSVIDASIHCRII
eukprot:277086_1